MAWTSRRDGAVRTPVRDGCTVLVVDDDVDVRTSIAQVLRTVGYASVQASDGIDAMRQLTATPVDAIVLDLLMPHMDGASLLRALSDPPPVVVLSAHQIDDATHRQVGGAIVADLRKPARPEVLLEAVALAVSRGGPSEGEAADGATLVDPH